MANIGIIINEDSEVTQGEWKGDSAYAFLKKGLNDGCLSSIRMPRFGTVMWVDDEFLFKGFAPNILATELVIEGGYPIEYPIMGPVVITGDADAHGNTLGLNAKQLAKIQEVVGE